MCRDYVPSERGVCRLCTGQTLERALEPIDPCRCRGTLDEPWNTLSNIPFVFLGLCGLFSQYMTAEFQAARDPRVTTLYFALTVAGLCSAVYHANARRAPWMIFVDWAGILFACSLFFFDSYQELLVLVSREACVIGVAAVFCLLADHLCRPMPPPILHTWWHVLSALAAFTAISSAEHQLLAQFVQQHSNSTMNNPF